MDVVAEYDLESHHVRLLQAACEAWGEQTRLHAGRDRVPERPGPHSLGISKKL